MPPNKRHLIFFYCCKVTEFLRDMVAILHIQKHSKLTITSFAYIEHNWVQHVARGGKVTQTLRRKSEQSFRLISYRIY